MTQIKIYSTTTCPWCHKLKEFLKENDVDFEDMDISANPKAAEEMIEKSGQMTVPVLDIDGAIIVGFDRESIARALGLSV